MADNRRPARFKYGDTVRWVWPGSHVECCGKIVSSTERHVIALDDRGHEHAVPHGQFRKADEAPSV